jgi:hypothetical protein
MAIDSERLITIIIQGGSFISTFAAIVAGIIMFRVTKKFGVGILASGFKSVSIGVIFIAFGIMVDAVQTYLQITGTAFVSTWLLIFKDILFIIGTYTIVIGSKKTGDRLESLT